MIAHVAEAGEGRGRIVLRIRREPSESAVRIAIRLAQVYEAELEALFVEEEDLHAFAQFSFACEMSPGGRALRRVSPRELARAFQIVRTRVQRRLAPLARQAKVALRSRTVCADPQRALCVACAASGPWNLIVLGEPVERSDYAALRTLFHAVPDATGVVLAGAAVCERDGPVVMALDRAEDLPGAMRVAVRLAGRSKAPVVILPVGTDTAAVTALDGEIRLALAQHAPYQPLQFAPAQTVLAPRTLHYVLQRLAAGFLIARLDGPVARTPEALDALRRDLECAVLLTRD